MRDLINIVESILPESDQSGLLKLYHITSKAKFTLNPNYAPEDISFSIQDRSGNKGIYLTPDVEKWVNGHGYIRPFVAEILADPSVLEHNKLGRWGGEIFVPADQFHKLKVNRVVPIDVIAREQFGGHGWIEGSHGRAFDSGDEIDHNAWYPYKDWKYDKDVRNMSPEEIQKLRSHFKAGYKARMRG